MLDTSQTLQNRYRITAQLGQIDSGLGYVALDTRTGKSVMLKETLSESATGPIPPSVRHQSLLCATDSFSEGGRGYLVLEHVEGRTLGELLEQKKSAFPVKDVALWADGLLDALNHLHTQQPPLIHANIKPQNIKLSIGGNVRLLVFGTGAANAAAAESMSFDAAVLGYLPIEQIWLGLDVGSQKVIRSGYDERSAEILESPLDVQSDVYSMGATLYHLLTGRVPADALTRSIELLEGKPDPLVPGAVANPNVPTEVSDVLLRAMQIRREERYGSASIFRQVLRAGFARMRNSQSRIEVPEPIEEETVLEIPLPSPVRQKPPAPVQVARAGMQSAESRQIEIIKRQLREAEARRLEAERRAADAEKRLLEHQTVEFKLHEAAPLVPELEPANPEPIVTQRGDTSEGSVEFSDRFGEPEPENKSSFAKVAGALVLVVALAAGGWGIWNFALSDAAPPKAETPAPAPKPVPDSSSDSPVATTAEPTPNAQIVTDTERPSEDQQSRPKMTPPPQQAKQKPSPTPTPKNAQPPKKSVTLDDLLKDN